MKRNKETQKMKVTDILNIYTVSANITINYWKIDILRRKIVLFGKKLGTLDLSQEYYSEPRTIGKFIYINHQFDRQIHPRLVKQQKKD